MPKLTVHACLIARTGYSSPQGSQSRVNCTACPAGTYARTTNVSGTVTVTCADCPDGFTSYAASTACNLCSATLVLPIEPLMLPVAASSVVTIYTGPMRGLERLAPYSYRLSTGAMLAGASCAVFGTADGDGLIERTALTFSAPPTVGMMTVSVQLYTQSDCPPGTTNTASLTVWAGGAVTVNVSQ